MNVPAGRTCPLRYRYGPQALRGCPEQAVQTLYVIGGLYGNRSALLKVMTMADAEPCPVRLCFNGDFNWFNVDSQGFAAINHQVLAHDTCQGNVEAELYMPGDESGCGCAYPESVDGGIVERSNTIHARLKHTAQQHPGILRQLSALPMFRRYRVGDVSVGVVHGDAESLAGWRFDATALDAPDQQTWLSEAFALAGVDVFASTHTCVPALRLFRFHGGRQAVINNGAAGMPNFSAVSAGLITRIGTTPSVVHQALYGAALHGAHIEALAVAYDTQSWSEEFLANWPPGSAAHTSYFQRIAHGPPYAVAQASPARA